ncbi:N-acetyltransferase [Segetibacter sp. 3557_3]|uniref:GNAT family N-acetyltransferase n=1 Tax=Segetibacter sp. 3557_3 TaxID=2547429 RepID=UPI0010587ABA|nr:GNAT family N-acetyltransferase [Segetibacter sp. 3557_3]TDH28559.1 N-acetyltransferase [Segetibacter sp. 3557_3]
MVLSNKLVVLHPLTIADHTAFFRVNTHPEVSKYFDEGALKGNETSLEFTLRLIRSCEYIFTIRSIEKPGLIIGDCALHDWNKQANEIEMGGALLPEYWGLGLMQSALDLLTHFANQELGIKTVLASTTSANSKAIRLIEKMGFKKTSADDVNTMFRKVV